MKTADEILRKFDEAIQYFINYPKNLPGTEFCNNVDKLINIKCDIVNKNTKEIMKTTKHYKIICPSCQGDGHVYNHNWNPNVTTSTNFVTCKACAGSGVQNVVEITKSK